MKQLSNSILVSAMTVVLMFGAFAFGVQDNDSDSGSATTAKSKAKDEAADTPAAKFKALKKAVTKVSSEQGKQIKELQKEYGDDREKMMEEFGKIRKATEVKTNELLAGALDIAKMNDDDSKTSLDAVSYVMSRSTDNDQKEMAIDLLVKHHIDNKKLVRKLAGMTGRGLPSRSTKLLFEKIIANSKNDEVKGYAALSLANHVIEIQDLESTVDDPSFAKIYPDVVKYFEEMKDEAALEKLRVRFDKIAKDYDDVELAVAIRSMGAKKGQKIGKVATKAFATHERKVTAKLRIAVGKEAPEIEGPDIDGETFKLSDYRGKVVLLDFWGDW